MPSLTALEISIHSTETDSFRIDSIPPLEEFWIRDNSGQNVLERGRIQGIPELIAKSSTCLRQLGLETCILYDRDPLLLDPYLHLTSPLHITHLTLMGYFVELNSAILPHLRYLSSIWIENYADARTRARRSAEQYGEPHHQESEVVTVDDIWKGLNREKIHLTKIDVDELPESLFHYLDSYTGLSSLSIGDAMWVPEAQSSRAARAIYSSALRNHVSSLERLSILSQPDSEWAFGDHSVSNSHLSYTCEF
ncbi:hypothetical protein BDQ17DRAFT_390732 [Cyathus striatus]|nr:hypothetical protein BDQ17DRAFT_390732 [Cyathus striatus]